MLSFESDLFYGPHTNIEQGIEQRLLKTE